MKTIIIAAALSLSGLSVTAAASTVEGPVSISIKTRDLDLGSTKGVEVLKLRIHRAVTQVCGDNGNSDYLQQRKAFQACYKAATESATAAVQTKMSATLAAR